MIDTNAIKVYAKKQGKKVGDICRALGYHPNKLSDVAKGRSSFSEADIAAIADMLEVLPEDLKDINALEGSIAERLFDPDTVYDNLTVYAKVTDGITYINITAENTGSDDVSGERKHVTIQCKTLKCTVDTDLRI